MRELGTKCTEDLSTFIQALILSTPSQPPPQSLVFFVYGLNR